MRKTLALVLLAALSTEAGRLTFFPATSTAAACTPCKRSICQQQCGPNKAAFCEIDEVTGCTYCTCYG